MEVFSGDKKPQWGFNKQNKLIELSNVKNKLESLSSKLEWAENRERRLFSSVYYNCIDNRK